VRVPASIGYSPEVFIEGRLDRAADDSITRHPASIVLRAQAGCFRSAIDRAYLGLSSG
jgi:hypothetical protein